MIISRITLALVFALGLGLAACEKEKGPVEKLGEKMDNAAGDVKSAAKDVKEDVEKAVD